MGRGIRVGLGFGGIGGGAWFLWMHPEQARLLWQVVEQLWARGLLVTAAVVAFMVVVVVIMVNAERIESWAKRKKQVRDTYLELENLLRELTPLHGPEGQPSRLWEPMRAHRRALGIREDKESPNAAS